MGKCGKSYAADGAYQFCKNTDCIEGMNYGSIRSCRIQDDDDEKDNEEFEWDDD